MDYKKGHYICKIIIEGYVLLIFFIVSISIIILCICKPFYCNLPTTIVDSINNALLAIATGYVSGYIIYFFSAILPKALRITSILSISKENFRYARDEIGGFFLDKGGPFEIDKKKVIELIPYFATTQKNEWYEIDKNNSDRLLKSINRSKGYLQFVISQADYLDDKDIEKIKDGMMLYNCLESRLYGRLETNKTIELTTFDQNIKEQMKHNSQLYHKNEVMEIIKGVQRLFKNLNSLYKKYENES